MDNDPIFAIESKYNFVVLISSLVQNIQLQFQGNEIVPSSPLLRLIFRQHGFFLLLFARF